MIRVPPKLRGSSPEAAWHNQMREVVMSIIPVQSVNNKISRTTKGTIIQGTSEGKKGGSGDANNSSAAVWL